MISRDELDILIIQMERAETFCRKARTPTKRDSAHSEPTEFYAGASGYAGATLRHAINSIQLHYNDHD